jgi:HD superfamily phosphodiesterase
LKRAGSARKFKKKGVIIVAIAAEKEIEHIGETAGASDHDHDMIHDLGKRLDALWRYDQYIANAKGEDELTTFWQSVKRQDEENIRKLKELIRKHVRADCF